MEHNCTTLVRPFDMYASCIEQSTPCLFYPLVLALLEGKLIQTPSNEFVEAPAHVTLLYMKINEQYLRADPVLCDSKCVPG